VLNGSRITVSSPEGQAGNLTITASTIQLDDNGQLTAVTGDLGREEGANITLNAEELLVMRNGSLISAEALGTANGGNIRINADSGFIIVPPFEDSDIIANAEFGNGGRIDITTRGIYGLEFRDELTPLSDITASSEFGLDGEIIIDTPDTDPNRGTVELPSDVIDASDSVAQACPSGVGTTTLGSFVVTGRGGLPPHPDAILDNDDVAADWVTPTDFPQYNLPPNMTVQPQQDSQTIVEADGWVMQHNGQVMLVAETQNTMPPSIPESCPVSPR
jgi:large exoprotein involved in heme utilization and adhesion